MIKINLVREGRAVRGAGAAPAAAAAAAGGKKLNNAMIVGALLAGFLIAGGYWLLTKRKLSEREATVVQRKAEADKLEAIIKEVEAFQQRKDTLQKRIDLINQLKQNQKGPVRIMDRISQDLPDLVWLDHMTFNAGRVTLSGRGLNPNAVANFVENVKNDSYFEEPELGSLSQISVNPPIYAFDMNFAFTYVPKGSTPPADAASGTATDTTASGTAAPGGAR